MGSMAKSRYSVFLSCALLLLIIAMLWSMPLQAEEGRTILQATYRPTLTPRVSPTTAEPTLIPSPTVAAPTLPSIAFVLTINTSSCVLSAVPPVEEAPAHPTYRPTLTPVPPTVDPNTAPTEEPFSLGSAPVYTIGEGCEAVVERLVIPQNDVRWFSLTLEGDDISLLPLQTVPNDPYPPQLDRRGRYFACSIPESGQQVCQVAVLVGAQAYIVQIPLNIEDAFFGPDFSPETTEAAP